MRTGNKFFTLICGVGFMLIAMSLTSPDPVQDADFPKSSVELGEALFKAKLLSSDRSVSCATCHDPKYAYSDALKQSPGVNGKLTLRNTPTIMYLTDRQSYFWDGRARTLEEQALMPITDPEEMDLSIEEAVKRLKEDSYFSKAFEVVFQAPPDEDLLALAIADYERSLSPYTSAYDRYRKGDTDAMSEAALRGMETFIYDGNCAFCHAEPLFTTDDYFNLGLYNGKDFNDAGRYSMTQNEEDLGKFRTPSLRNIALTAPYMHNGMFNTLREVLEFYNNPRKAVKNRVNQHPFLKPLKLSDQELDDLEAFLLTLTDTVMTSRK